MRDIWLAIALYRARHLWDDLNVRDLCGLRLGSRRRLKKGT